MGILLGVLLALSMMCNAVLSWKLIEAKNESEVTQEILEQTQSALEDTSSKSAHKVGTALMKAVYGVKDAQKLAALELKYAHKYDIPVQYGMAISAQESRWDIRAVSYNNTSFGIKQIHCKVWCEYFGVSKEELFDPEVNIELGYKILALYRDQYGSIDRALMAYYGSTRQWENEEYLANVKRKARLFEMV